MWIVLTALRRPYTFVVLAVTIALFGVRAALLTPTDIFPNINIPVVSVVWTYTGLLPNDMSGRVIYFYERYLTAQVSDIEHIESQSLSGYGVVKIFFQKNVDIAAALAQVTAASQTVLKLLPPGITPPYVLSYNASSVPILQLALSSKKLPQMQLFDLGQNFIRPQLATVAGAAVPSPYGGKILQVQVDLDQHAMQAHNVSADDVLNAVSVQNLILPAGDEKIGKFDWNVALNASPVLLERINDLPVRKVNDTIIYVRDVAYVHQGSPPQTNLVRVNGSRAVLMTILKAGAASTLSVIDGIKSLLPRVEESLPSSLNLRAVGDQSIFVKAAVFGVMREAALAAALVGVMILVFLGSWRSTVIILIEIPLAILFSLTALSWLGETVNVMTLGGLALAVGILVDDGTVTIENINYHLEQGKEIEPAILDGAQQIVIPAFVTLLCLCIVFVPMFQLGGVAGHLFRPLAEAVVFALIGSFILSRTLVPTMANYLMRGEHGGHGHSQPGVSSAGAQSSQAFPTGVRRPFRANTRALPVATPARPRLSEDFHRRIPRLRSPVLWPVAVPGAELLPGGRFRTDPDACARAARHPHRGDRPAVRCRRADRPPNHPARATRQHRRQYRPAVFRHQHGLPEHRNDRTGGRRCFDHPQGGSFADRGVHQRVAHHLAAEISRHHLLVPARRHRLADSQFRPAGADRRPGHRQQPEGQLRLCHRSAQAHPHRSRHRRPAHPAGIQLSADQRRGGSDACRPGRADPARYRQQSFGDAVGQRPGEAEFLAEHQERRLLPDRCADAAIPHRLDVGPRQRADYHLGDEDAAISGRPRDR